jgi:hypothetical protein
MYIYIINIYYIYAHTGTYIYYIYTHAETWSKMCCQWCRTEEGVAAGLCTIVESPVCVCVCVCVCVFALHHVPLHYLLALLAALLWGAPQATLLDVTLLHITCCLTCCFTYRRSCRCSQRAWGAPQATAERGKKEKNLSAPVGSPQATNEVFLASRGKKKIHMFVFNFFSLSLSGDSKGKKNLCSCGSPQGTHLLRHLVQIIFNGGGKGKRSGGGKVTERQRDILL